MSSAVPVPEAHGRLGSVVVAVLVALLGLVTLAAGLLSGGNLVLTALPVVVVAIAIFLVRSPLRWPATALLFLLLALEVKGDASGIFNTPLITLGDLLTDISGSLTGVKVAGFEILMVFLLAIGARRRWRGQELDGPPSRAPGVIKDFLILYLAGFCYAAIMSLATSHGLPMWKARYILHVPFLYLFFQVAYPEAIDVRPLATAVVAAAEVKAILAAYIQEVAAPDLTGGPLAFATNHGDSILFTMAIAILIIGILEMTSRRTLWRALLLIPLPLWGLVLNRRRVGWAMLEVSVLMVIVVSSWKPWKRWLVKGAMVGFPLLLIYFTVGWNSDGTGIFGPVHKVRTMLDSSVDSSTYWREVESWNIAKTLNQTPLIGLGLGGEYTEFMKNDDISVGYPEYREWPHNTVLGQLLLEGVVGFALIWMPNLIAIFLAVRVYRRAFDPVHRAAALACVCAVVCCAFMAWGDTGVHFMQHKLSIALALVVAGKLAHTTGAWPRELVHARNRARGGGDLPLIGRRGSAGTTG